MMAQEDNWHIVLIVCILHYVLYLIYIFTYLFFEVKLQLLFKTAKKNWLNLSWPDHLAPWRAVGANLDEINIPKKSTHILICFHALALMGISQLALLILPIFGESARIGRATKHGLARPFQALFARISCNTFLESLKHTDQPYKGFVSGA